MSFVKEDECHLKGIVGDKAEKLKESFSNAFDGQIPEWIIRVPGRVNIIGEHIDYCGYGVLPMAIEPCILLALKRRRDTKICLVNDEGEIYPPHQFESSEIENEIAISQGNPHWWNYFLCGLKGSLLQLKESNSNFSLDVGMYCLVQGSIPPASGLSSSSAVVVAAAMAFMTISDQLETQERFKLADLCASSERFIGTQGGGMDQAIEILGVKGKAQFIDFDPLRVSEVSLPKEACFVIANSLTEANKAAGSEFNQRVVECRLAAMVLAKHFGLSNWRSLRKLAHVQAGLGWNLEASLDKLGECLHQEPYDKSELSSLLGMTKEELDVEVLTPNTRNSPKYKLYPRAHHVFSEARRVENYREICSTSNSSQVLSDLGSLMYQSHKSCSETYECSHPNLDRLVQLSKEAGAFGARLTGAGWGGCMVALVASSQVTTFMARLQKDYFDGHQQAAKMSPSFYLFQTYPSQGAQIFRIQDQDQSLP